MKIVILGAGPAGLAAAYALCKRGERPIVLEKSGEVGGICRTVNYKGYIFDIGGHRFFTKFDEVQALWEEVLGNELVVRPRLSRIYYNGDFYDYPLRAANALRNLGPVESARCMLSYARASARPRGGEDNFEEWVSNRFGDRLFNIFFKSYTEKVWGIPTAEIGAEWAAQRIKNLELSTAVKDAVLRPLRGALRPRGKQELVTSLIEQFHYPLRGPGQMYDRMRDRVLEMGGQILLHHGAERVEHTEGRVHAVVARGPQGELRLEADVVMSSMPLTLLVRALHPRPPEDVWASAHALTYRNLLTVDLLVDRTGLFPDNWIYIHDPRLRVGRIQNFGNWSSLMVPNPGTSALGMEYFCSDDDDIWRMSEAELLELGARELKATGLLDRSGAKILDGTTIRVPRAYPVYKRGYKEHLDRITAHVRGFQNLMPMGRYGMFKYNNSDHSILTALLSVENLFGAQHDVWEVNTDSDYHEIRKG